MGGKTEIAWTDASWNPVSGCTQVSPGCAHCYAERLAKRLPISHARGKPFSEVVCHPDRLAIPLHWRKPRRIFVCSMGDLFHEDVPFEFVAAVFGVMAACPQHTFQVLTKRSVRMAEWFNSISHTIEAIDSDGAARVCIGNMDRYIYRARHVDYPTWPLPNVWLGVTAEDQQRADERIPLLLQCPSAVSFVSVEPMLGPVDLLTAVWAQDDRPVLGAASVAGIDWVIVGCESGPGRRHAEERWFVSLRDQCLDAGVPFFLKQMEIDGAVERMPMLDATVYAEFPEVK